MDQKTIHINWEGPLSYSDLSLLNKEKTDYGVYQIYASHPIYGSNVLVFIGKADKETFSVRIKQEQWNNQNGDGGRIQIYVGRLAGTNTPDANVWFEEINLVEKLLIHSHWPAANSYSFNPIADEQCKSIHILNWGQHRDLMPEVSGARHTTLYSTIENYNMYGGHPPVTKSPAPTKKPGFFGDKAPA
jgi:hypothetical protein